MQVKALQEAGEKGLSNQAGAVLQGLTYLPGNSEKNFQANALRGRKAASLSCQRMQACAAVGVFAIQLQFLHYLQSTFRLSASRDQLGHGRSF